MIYIFSHNAYFTTLLFYACLAKKYVRSIHELFFFPLISTNGMNQNREKIQQYAFSEIDVFKNKDCQVKKS